MHHLPLRQAIVPSDKSLCQQMGFDLNMLTV